MRETNRRTVIKTLGTTLPFGGTSLETASEQTTSKQSQTMDTDVTDTSENDDTEPFNVTIDAPETVTEGSTETISFRISNPSEEKRMEPVTVQRGSWVVLFEENILLPPQSSQHKTVKWNVRPDAAGHTMELQVEAKTRDDTALVDGQSKITPTIESISTSSCENKATVKYRVSNEGTAPVKQIVTIRVDGEKHAEKPVWLPIAGSDTNSVTVPLNDGDESITVETSKYSASEHVEEDQ